MTDTCQKDYADLLQKYNTQTQSATSLTTLTTNFLPTLTEMLCGPECQKQKELADLKQKYIDAQNTKATAPPNLHVARKNYVIADIGEPAYNDEIEKELTAKANIIAKTYNDQFDSNINQLELLSTTYDKLITGLATMDKYNTNLVDSTQYSNDEIALNTDTIIMNNRKTYYETQNYDIIKDWYKLFSWIYWLLFIIFALSLFLVKNELSTKTKGAFIIGFIIYYFAMKYIIIYFFKFLVYLYNLLPKTVYTSI